MAKVGLIALLCGKAFAAGDTLTFNHVAKYLTRAGVKEEMHTIVESEKRLGLLIFEEGSRLRLL